MLLVVLLSAFSMAGFLFFEVLSLGNLCAPVCLLLMGLFGFEGLFFSRVRAARHLFFSAEQFLGFFIICLLLDETIR
jgi:hypothetical protein